MDRWLELGILEIGTWDDDDHDGFVMRTIRLWMTMDTHDLDGFVMRTIRLWMTMDTHDLETVVS
jgi:hypothetical protein